MKMKINYHKGDEKVLSKYFDVLDYIGHNYLYDICSENLDFQNFINYLSNKNEMVINFPNHRASKQAKFLRLLDTEKVARARLQLMTTVSCCQELTTEILSRINARIEIMPEKSLFNEENKPPGTDPSLREALKQLELFLGGVGVQSSSVLALLIHEAVEAKVMIRKYMLGEKNYTEKLSDLLLSSPFSCNLFDENMLPILSLDKKN